MIRPVPLKMGDTIGVISPSSPVAALYPGRFDRGVANLKAMGFSVLISEHARSRYGHTAGTIEERVDDFHAMFANEEVKAVIASIGGYNSNQLLEYLDYDLIEQNPKIFMGYSDITALLLALYKRTGLVTFMGPALLPQFGEYDGLHPYSEKWFRRLLMEVEAPLELTPSATWICEYLEWDIDDTRRRVEIPNSGPKVLKPGSAEGRIISGNLGTMLTLAGTPYFPDLDGAILCIEEDEEETPATVDRLLTQLRLIGAFERVAALVVGRFHPKVGFTPADSLEYILLRVTRDFNLPVAIDFDFGHTDPMFPLANGVMAKVEFAERARFILLENGVCGCAQLGDA